MSKDLLSMVVIMILLFLNFASQAEAEKGDDGSGRNEDQKLKSSSMMILDVVKSFTAPGLGDPRGLTWMGGHLWMAENDTKMIFKIDTLSGAVIDSFPTPGVSNTQGLTWDGVHFWHAEYNGMVFKIDPTNGAFLDTIMAPTTKPTGLTWDGTYLWVASYIDDYIYQFSSENGTLIHSFAAPNIDPWGLTWADTSLWNAQFNGKNIYELNPLNGEVRSSYPSPLNSHLLGLTTDGAHLWAVDNHANTINKFDITAITDIEEMNVNQPTDRFQLMQNYPNPFNPSTKIRFTLPEPVKVRIEIYNTLGQKMKVLLSEPLKAGDHEIEFSADNLPGGIYFYRIDAGKFQDVKKMILIK